MKMSKNLAQVKREQELTGKLDEFTQSMMSIKPSPNSAMSSKVSQSVILQLQEMRVSMENLDETFNDETILSKVKHMHVLAKYNKSQNKTNMGSFATTNSTPKHKKMNLFSQISKNDEDEICDNESSFEEN